MNAFDNIVRAMLLKCGTAIHENEVVSSVRDLLLPKLMAGEIRLKDAEKVAEAAL